MCNLYSVRTNQEAIRGLFGVTRDQTGNLPVLPAVFPNYDAPIVRLEEGERTLSLYRWGMPSPSFALKGKKVDPGVTNVRNTKSPHWRRWLGPESRCLVPFTSFSEFDKGKREDVWFAAGEGRPLMCFAGIKTEGWRSTRKVKDGETTDDLYAFLTTEANREVGEIHPKAMPVILTESADLETWLHAPWEEAQRLQRPLPDGALTIVARGAKRDGEAETS